MGLFKPNIIKMNDTGAFVSAAFKNASTECRIKITQFQTIYGALSDGLNKQGLSSSQSVDTFWARLSASCPQCGLRINGEHLGILGMMSSIGYDRVVGFNLGWALRFGKGNCPNQACPSREIVLRWETHPSDDLAPFTPIDGDADALKEYWQNLAIQWWKTRGRREAICDKCYGRIPADEGYYSPCIYTDLVCERCVGLRLTPDRLETLYHEKTSSARNELRAARQMAGIA
jgi:hypothetical protein